MGKNTEFEHLSGRLTSREIGLGWLDGLTLRTAFEAASISPHCHQHMEVILCLRGEINYKIDGYRPVLLGADRGIVIPAQRRHALKNNSELPGERLGLHLLGKMTKSRAYAIFSDDDYLDFQRILTTAAAHPFRLSPSLKNSARELADYLKRPRASIHSSEYGLIRILSCSILYNLVKTLSEPRVSPKPQLMDEAVSYLKAHWNEPFRIDNLVRHMGYSRASLFTLFKRHTGLTPNDYLVRLRINHAREMLVRQTPNIAEIAGATGFKSPEYFSAVFHRYVGRTPSEFREQRGVI